LLFAIILVSGSTNLAQAEFVRIFYDVLVHYRWISEDFWLRLH